VLFKGIKTKNIICAGLATSMEYFDFTLFSLCVIYISKTFFPDTMSSSEQIISAFGLFAAGYVMRPLGGIFFGNLGDKIGRKKVLIITVALMCLSMVIMTFTPSYNVGGLGSVLLILVARFIQGFSIGGEYNGVIATLSEQANHTNRASVTSMGTFLEGNGCLFAVVLMVILTSIYTNQQMYDYGWRVAYFIGVIFSIVALVAQFMQDESRQFIKVKEEGHILKTPFLVAIKSYLYQIFIVFCLAGYLGVAYYMIMGFMPSYMEHDLKINYNSVMWLTAVASFGYAWSAPFWGRLADKTGRKPVLLGNAALIAVLVYPTFMTLTTGDIWLMGAALTLLMILIAGATATFVTLINELFPTNVRFSGVATGYNVSNAIFGGTTPLVASLFIFIFGQFGASYYLVVLTLILFALLWKMPETKGIEFSSQHQAD